MEISANTNEDIKEVGPAVPSTIVNCIEHREVSYDHSGEWGMVNNPVTEDSKRLAKNTYQSYPFVNLRAIYEMLIHALDNVANHGLQGRYAKGTVVIGDTGTDLVFQITNTTAHGIPARLKDKIITGEDGVIDLTLSERDAERTGGGNGTHSLTQWLPYVYSGLADPRVDKQPQLFWTQRNLDGDRKEVTFELRIPLLDPYERERIDLRITLERNAEESFDKAQHFIAASKTNTGLSIAEKEDGAKLCQDALEAWLMSGNQNSSNRLGLFEAIVTLGPVAESCAPALRAAIVQDVGQYLALKALDAIETDPTTSIVFFSMELARHGFDPRSKDSAVDLIATYAKNKREVAAPLAKELRRFLRNPNHANKVCEALIACGVSAEAVEEAISILETESPDKFGNLFKAVIGLLGAQGTLGEKACLALVGLLGAKDFSYYAGEALQDRPLPASVIPKVRSILKDAAENEGSVYYVDEIFPNIEGKKALFGDIRALLSVKNAQYSGAKMLQGLDLGNSELNVLAEDCKALCNKPASEFPDDGSKEELGYLLQVLSNHPKVLQRLQGDLVTALLNGNSEYRVAEVLKTQKIGFIQHQRLKSARNKSENTSYYVRSVLEAHEK